MSRDKQMFNDLVEIFDEEYGRRNLITPQNTAEKLTAKGYRKSTEVAEEIFGEIEETFKECLWFLENHPSDYPRMDRTKINVYKDNLQYIAELKKKYTEEEK